MSEEFDDLYTGLIASIDQTESMLKDTATIFSTYYKALIGEGLTNELARELVLDYHRIFWKRIHGVSEN